MTDILLAYIPCKSLEQAKTIGTHLLGKRLCACINIFPEMHSTYFWPPNIGKLEEASEVVLIAKTTKGLFPKLEEEVLKIHTYKCPCVMAIPVEHMNAQYEDWLKSELKK